MKIIITESQLKLIKEAVGVPENILDEGKAPSESKTKLIKRISKVYSLIPDKKEQTNESILDWELHQKLMEKRYGKRPIQKNYSNLRKKY